LKYESDVSCYELVNSQYRNNNLEVHTIGDNNSSLRPFFQVHLQKKTMSNIDEIPVRLYDGSVEDRHFMSKDEALRYVKDFFNREADKIDQNIGVPINGTPMK
jgi:hypothetical protein